MGYFAFRLLVQYFFSRSEIAFQEQGVKELLKLVVSITLAGVILWLGGSIQIRAPRSWFQCHRLPKPSSPIARRW